jgi:thioredoxin reductase
VFSLTVALILNITAGENTLDVSEASTGLGDDVSLVVPNGLMTHLRVKDVLSNAEEVVEANGLFYAVGHDPARV